MDITAPAVLVIVAREARCIAALVAQHTMALVVLAILVQADQFLIVQEGLPMTDREGQCIVAQGGQNIMVPGDPHTMVQEAVVMLDQEVHVIVAQVEPEITVQEFAINY